MIAIVDRFKRNWMELAQIQFSVSVQHALVYTYIHDLADDVTLLCLPEEYTLQRYRQLIKERGVYKRAFLECKPDLSIFFDSLFAETNPT